MKESQQIEQRINALQKRRASVAVETEAAEQRLTQARREAVSGDGAAVDGIVPAQGSYDALCGLLGKIDAQLIEMRAKFRDAQAEEKRAADAQSVRELNEQKQANAEEYDERLKSIDEYLRAQLPGLAAQRRRDGELRREIAALGGLADTEPLAERRWSTSGLKYAPHIATMLAEQEREEERREQEQRRVNARERARLKVA